MLARALVISCMRLAHAHTRMSCCCLHRTPCNSSHPMLPWCSHEMELQQLGATRGFDCCAACVCVRPWTLSGHGRTACSSASLQVVVPLPDEAGRRDILNVHLRGIPMASAEEKTEAAIRLARVTAGARSPATQLARVAAGVRLLAYRLRGGAPSPWDDELVKASAQVLSCSLSEAPLGSGLAGRPRLRVSAACPKSSWGGLPSSPQGHGVDAGWLTP